ncbi:MAG TPA: isoprenylcysteine carboxylmethyltransferase family protein [Sphingomonadaceae bacterium]|nr:isoprenylcysteine carboxylmethyltransferase family protein [Sphingomonadaceae bacterium]
MTGILKADEDSAKVGFPPPFVYLGFLLLGKLADRLAGFSLPLGQPVRIAAVAILVTLGLLVVAAALFRFRQAGTDPEPWKTSSTIVRRGIYRVTRNPMYLGMALAYLGLALGLASPAALALFPVVIWVIRTQVIAREERYLEAKFGGDYLSYKADVRRWF